MKSYLCGSHSNANIDHDTNVVSKMILTSTSTVIRICPGARTETNHSDAHLNSLMRQRLSFGDIGLLKEISTLSTMYYSA